MLNISLLRYNGSLLVGDLAEVLLHTVAAGPGRSVIHQVREKLMALMAAILAALTDPVDVARFATEVVVGGRWLLVIVEGHAFQSFITV